MHRIDSSGAVASRPTQGSVGGVVGYFTEGDPSLGVPATVVSKDWMNSVQTEIENVVVAAGLTLNKAADNQLLAAIKVLSKVSGFHSVSADYVILDADGYEVIEVDCTGGNRVISLPLSASNTRREILIIRKDASGNSLTVQRKAATADTLQGTSITSFTLDEQGHSARMVANGGTVWYKV